MESEVKIAMTDFKKVLRITADVVLADGYSDAMGRVLFNVHTDTQTEEYPATGYCKSEKQIRRMVLNEVENSYPSIAFPYRKIGVIDLYVRDDARHDCLRYMSSLKGD